MEKQKQRCTMFSLLRNRHEMDYTLFAIERIHDSPQIQGEQQQKRRLDTNDKHKYCGRYISVGCSLMPSILQIEIYTF